MKSLTAHQETMYDPIIGNIKQSHQDFPNKATLPTVENLNQQFAATQLGQKKKLICQNENMEYSALGYEERIYKHGLIATRLNNWHDFFNAQVWQLFPKIKSALNQSHYKEQQQQSDNKRTRRRDLMTLFDENGVFIKAPDEIKELIVNHQWHQVFCQHKQKWLDKEIEIVTFGHALYEKYLNPYIGMTAHSVFVDNLDIKNLDSIYSQQIIDKTALIFKKELNPLPLLGIPDWSANQDEKFYSNKIYFR